jgi:hypothetical protein
VSKNTGADARVPKYDMKKPDAEIWLEETSYTFAELAQKKQVTY